MIKLHDAEENFDFWVNENQIVSIEYAFSKNGTELFLQNGMTFQVTETPEEILVLMVETTQPAPVKNNITKWIENVDKNELRMFMNGVVCKYCPVNDRLCQCGLVSCSCALKHWALEVSE